ncbi:MAG: hypothetical protein QW343_04290 [Candidatus Norongarragalinales archaeon]
MTKKSSWMLVLVAVVLVGAAYFFYVTNPSAFASVLGNEANSFLENQERQSHAYAARHAQNFVSFTHPLLGYVVKYPIGYNAVLDEEDGITFTAWANSPVSASEVITVRAGDKEFTEQNFKDAATSFPAEEFVSAYRGTLNAKRIYLLTVKKDSEATTDKIIVRNAFFPDCKALDGTRYTAVVTVAIPQLLSEDLDLADYIIYSFKC